MRPRVILLATNHSYRTPAFIAAAQRLDIELLVLRDWPATLAAELSFGYGAPFNEPEQVLRLLRQLAAEGPIAGVLAADDVGAQLAALAGTELGLPHNDPAAVEAARDKYVMRRALQRAGAPGPAFRLFSSEDGPDWIAAQVCYPCVLKPTRRTGSQGVMRADSPGELVPAIERLVRLLHRVDAGSGPPWPLLVEDYVPGREVALEGLLVDGELHVLALFDKPDPLEGPFFEETVYTTPSRLPAETQALIARRSAEAAAALGLRRGPVHAELRLPAGDAWIVEIAGRSIGGLCSQALLFGVSSSLEELILRQAAGLPLGDLTRRPEARGVMMIPIPAAGILRGVYGLAEAEALPGIEAVTITAPLHNRLAPLPEGDSYLGFIFARAEAPAEAEAALRRAHQVLRFDIEPLLELRPAAEAALR